MTDVVDPFVLKQHDTAPALEAVLKDGEEVVDLTDASVEFVMSRVPSRDDCREATIRAAATVAEPAAGLVRYFWVGGDTAVVGRYRGEFKVSRSGTISTYPSVGFIPILVGEDAER